VIPELEDDTVVTLVPRDADPLEQGGSGCGRRSLDELRPGPGERIDPVGRRLGWRRASGAAGWARALVRLSTRDETERRGARDGQEEKARADANERTPGQLGTS
jgi:hypothetical protein